MVDIHTIYVNKKNKKEYLVQAIGTNKTNYNDGEIMVRYIEILGNGEEYYREIEEFDEKFKRKKFKDA